MSFMNPVQFFLASIASYSGIIAGMLLISSAREEQKPLRKYFIISNYAISALIVLLLGLFLFYRNIVLFYAFIILSGLLFVKNNALLYAVLGLFYYVSSKNPNLFVIISSLVFIYGLVHAALNYDVERKNWKRLLTGSILFIATSNLIYHFSFLIPV